MEKRPELRLIHGQGEDTPVEDIKTERVLRVVRGLDWGYLHELPSVPGNPFYDRDPEPPEAA